MGQVDTSLGASNDGLDAEGGQAVDFCESLILDADGDETDETNWYLPSQKELMQAYIDGSANNLPSPDYDFWSSTELCNFPSGAWSVSLSFGGTGYDAETGSRYVRCVIR